MGPTFIVDAGPDSILLNGKTIYDSANINKDCKGVSTIDVEPNKTYRLRFIGALTFRILGILTQEHNMTLIEIDGEYVEPYQLKYLEIGPGQRMSVLINTGNYSAGTLFPIATNYRWRNNGRGYTKNGYGYLRYVSPQQTDDTIVMNMPSISSLPTNIFPLVDTPGWVLGNVKPLVTTESDLSIINKKADHTIKLSMTEVVEVDNTTRYRNNGRQGIPWGSYNASLIDQILSGTLGSVGELSVTDGFSTSHQTYPLGYNQIIDLVFQNNMIPSGLCVIHPWHTHGHSHYLLTEGPGDYVHETDKDLRTFNTPLLKDVSMAYPSVINGSTGCGWTKVRILTVSILKINYKE
jgi:FtsP/CotA-like multicopper oxidase with cupredoxin domain